MLRLNKSLLLAVFCMIICVISSNLLVKFPINAWLTWGAFTYPSTYVISELVNRFHGQKHARKVVYAGFFVAIILSFTWFDKRIAIASCTAFLLSQLLDINLFARFRQNSWWVAPLIASSLATAVDTFIFFAISFYGTDVPWVTLSLGDYCVKLMMDMLFLFPFRIFIARSLVQASA
jgi:hypothetical protein